MGGKYKKGEVMLYLLMLIQLLCSSLIFSQKESLRELDQLILSKSISKADKEKYIQPMLALLRNLESKEIIDVTFTLPLIKEGHSETYVPLNPSIIKTANGYDIMCKVTNLKIPDYRTIVSGDTPKIRNFFLRYDKDFNLLSEQEITIPSHLTKNINEAYQVEDGRIFYWDNSHWLVGCSAIKSSNWLQKVAVCRLSCELNSFDHFPRPTIETLALFHGPEERRHEKNWMPIVRQEKLRFIYSYDPFILIEPNMENGTFKTVLSYSPKLDFSYSRGSAAPIDFDNGYLMVVHERVQNYSYTHRFLYLDAEFRITKISLPFTFTHVGVEFCTSMTFDHSGENLLIGVGIEDKEAKIIILDPEYVKGLLFDIKSCNK